MHSDKDSFLDRLTIDSTIVELPYWDIALPDYAPGREAAALFDQNRHLPGILIFNQHGYRSMISRERFYNHLGQRFGPDLFYNRPIQGMCDSAPDVEMTLDYRAPIQAAAEACMLRPKDIAYEALVVTFPLRQPRIVDFRDLIVAATRLLALANEQSRVASEAKDEFLATMSHELRTPLTSILGYAQILKAEELLGQDTVVSWAGKIHTSGRQLLELIDSVLDFSKLDAQRMELDLQTFDIASLVREVQGTIAPLVEPNGNEFCVRYGPDPGTMRADPQKLRQNLLNLLGNACKFTHQGKIELEIFRSEDRVIFVVRDTGIGMTAEQIARIFEPFIQGDSSTTRKYGGTGLGLAITQRFCHLMGGKITVQSQPTQGATFRMELPAWVQPQEPDHPTPIIVPTFSLPTRKHPLSYNLGRSAA